MGHHLTVLEGGDEVTPDELESIAELHRMIQMGLEVGLWGAHPHVIASRCIEPATHHSLHA